MGSDQKMCPVHFDRYTPDYREQFVEITEELHQSCPVAWSDTHDGHWVVSGYSEVFEIARSAANLSNDYDVHGVRKGYKGIPIPYEAPLQVGFLEMDPPEQRDYRAIFNPYLTDTGGPVEAARGGPDQSVPGRGDRVGPDRLHRRPGQHRPGGDDLGDDGDPARGLADLLL